MWPSFPSDLLLNLSLSLSLYLSISFSLYISLFLSPVISQFCNCFGVAFGAMLYCQPLTNCMVLFNAKIASYVNDLTTVFSETFDKSIYKQSKKRCRSNTRPIKKSVNDFSMKRARKSVHVLRFNQTL